MVWTDVVGDPVNAEGGPDEGGLFHEPSAVPVSGHDENPSLDKQLPATGDSELSPAGIDSILFELRAGLATLTSQVAAFNERSAAQESIITRMQQRLEELQGDQVRALLRPVFEQLGALHGDITAVAERESRATKDVRLGKELAFLTNRVEAAFEALGLVSVGAQQGVVFDSRLHAAVRSQPTHDAALDKSIAEVQRQGFMRPGTTKTELHARVVVYSHDPQSSTGLDADPTAPANLSAEEGPAAAFPESSGSVVPTASGRSERTPQVPLPPMPPSYIEGS